MSLLIQAITFDFWNTLCVGQGGGGLRRQHIRQALEQAGYGGISDAQIDNAMSRAWREWDRIWEQEQRTFGAAQWISLVLADLNASLAQPQREALIDLTATAGMQKDPLLVDDVASVLPSLARRYRLAVICDTGLSPGRMLRQWMASHGILQYFTHLTFSDELGISKPHPEAFLTTLDRLSVVPQAAVHVGDYPRTDVAGAQAVGMRAIRFAGVQDWDDGTVRAHAVIHSHHELEPLLDRWQS